MRKRRRILLSALVALLLATVLSLGAFSHAKYSFASCGTRCDPAGTVELSGSNWLNGNGVDVYSNGARSTNDSGRHYTNNVYDGEKWQCVELVNRLYLTRGWISSTWWGDGDKLANALPSGLSYQKNGSITYLNTGDVISFGDSTTGTVNDNGGHASIVNTVSGSIVTTVNQNTPDVYNTLTFSNGSIAVGAGWSGYYVIGVIHRPGRTSSEPGWTGVGNATFLGTDQLNVGQVVFGGQYLVSGNAQYALILQSDGNLVLYNGASVLWASGTSGNPGASLNVQSDGNLVIYSSSGQALWVTNTAGQGLADLIVQSDGNVVAYSPNGMPIWATNTGGRPTYTSSGSDRLYNGQELTTDEFLVSSDNRYALLMQSDGNLVLYGPGYHVLWASGTSGNPGASLNVQSDGNLVIYSSSGQALWATNTAGQGLSFLVLQPDGNLAAYDASSSAIWATSTNGEI